MADSLNLGTFRRIPFTNDDHTLTPQAASAMAIVQRRSGDIAGLVYADTITNVPAGGVTEADVQGAIDGLESRKLAASLVSAFILTLLNDADAATARGTLGLGTISTQAAGSVSITGGSVLVTTGVGYNTGAGGAVTQAASKATAVTLDKYSGEITLNNAALAAATTVSFTFTNSTIAATDQVVVTHHSAGTGGAYTVSAFPAAGSATVFVRNVTAGSLSEAIVLKFNVFKSATS